MKKPVYPAYDNSILNIIASICKAYHLPCSHKSHQLIDDVQPAEYKNVVLMVLDGLGLISLIEHLKPTAFLRRHLIDSVSSVFPSTTTAATVTLESGLSPIEHAWLGWSLYFKEIDHIVNIYPNTLTGKGGVSAADYHVAYRYIPYPPIYNQIVQKSNGRTDACCVSPFSAYRIQSSDENCEVIRQLCEQPGARYIYSYWYEPDDSMHGVGVTDPSITKVIEQLNEQVERMCQSLHNTLVIITADHGLIDVHYEYMSEHPELSDCLIRMPTMEQRALSFFVKPDRCDEFKTQFEKRFSDQFMLLSKKRILDEKWFGPGKPHPKIDDFIGDYVAISTADTAIAFAPRSDKHEFVAAHAGLTKREMIVPLILVAT